MTKLKHTLSQLLAKCDPNAPFPAELKEWDQMQPVGREWDSFFTSEKRVSDDFALERGSQNQSARENLDM